MSWCQSAPTLLTPLSLLAPQVFCNNCNVLLRTAVEKASPTLTSPLPNTTRSPSIFPP